MQPTPARVCPACGMPNECVPVRTGNFDTPCWCESIIVNDAAIAALPVEERGQACLCVRCASASVASGKSGA